MGHWSHANYANQIYINLYIEVLSNTHPDFVTEPDTSFTMAVGDVISYKLPPVVDPDGNDIPVLSDLTRHRVSGTIFIPKVYFLMARIENAQTTKRSTSPIL